MKLFRSSGVLTPITSLPSAHGIGTMGQAAFDFIDFLAEARQRWWQILPVGPTSYGDSPYSGYSTFAGNPYYVDLDQLVADGLLDAADLEGLDWGDARYVDYDRVYALRFPLLRKATARGLTTMAADFDRFRRENARWLEPYALYMALKDHFDGAPWMDWDADIRLRKPEAVARWTKLLEADVTFYAFVQFLFFRQWERLRSYAREKGVGIIGDMPIYVAMDSSDVWAEPQFFQLDDQCVPKAVSGVPPDAFTDDGQLWGTPLYDWDALRADGYGWWIRRVEGAEKLYDALRIDHFRAFEAYWSVPYGETTAKNGRWVKGPGMDLVGRLTAWFNNMQFIAEDLGYITPELHSLLEESKLPGMKVLEFAFDHREPSDYLPHNYSRNCICYAGTHDNNTLLGWLTEISEEDLDYAAAYLGLNPEEGYAWGVLRGGMSSVAELFVAQIQDYLGLGSEARINTPGTAEGNWRWRLLPGELTSELAKKIAAMTRRYGRG